MNHLIFTMTEIILINTGTWKHFLRYMYQKVLPAMFMNITTPPSGFSRKFRVEGDIIKVGGKSLNLKAHSALHAAQTRVVVGLGGGLPPPIWGVRGAVDSRGFPFGSFCEVKIPYH